MTTPTMFDLVITSDGVTVVPPIVTVDAPPCERRPVRAHTRRVRRGPVPTPPTPQTDREAERRRIRARDQERLEPLMRDLARRRGPEGITAAELIAEGITRGVFTGQETAMGQQRALSWIGPWLAALAKRGVLARRMDDGVEVRRRSERAQSHGNLQLVYVLAEPVHA